MNKIRYMFPVIVICSLVMFSACNKTEESSEEKNSQAQKAEATPPAALNPEQTTGSYEGCLDAGMLKEGQALEYLKILAAGDHETIDYYREFEQSENRQPMGTGESWYENDICATVKVLSKKNNPEAYDLILQVMDQKNEYPNVMVCAIRAIMIYGQFKDGQWQGDKRSIPVLKKTINNDDPDIRLNAAGALLSLGEGGIALPVLDEIIKAGKQHSITAMYKLFTPEEVKNGAVKRIVRSTTRMFDERGKDILVRALNYSSDEVRGFAALRLMYMGIEQKRAEETATDILKVRMVTGRKKYENMQEQQSDRSAISNAIAVLEEIASNESAGVIMAFSESFNDPSFKARAEEALRNIRRRNRTPGTDE